MTMAPFMWCR